MPVRIEHLNKHIGRQHVLRDISLTIRDGEVIGLLGPNGAGKSTLMKIMVGLWEADGGSKVDVPPTHGYLPEQNPLYPDMYVREYLRFMECLTGGAGDEVESLIDRVGLTAEAHKRIGELSKGYRQRVGLAQALLGNPELLILDEPTTGLDPNQLADIRALIRDLGRDRTVILSTHILQEVSAVCSRVVILDHGQIKADKAIQDIDSLEQLFGEVTK